MDCNCLLKDKILDKWVKINYIFFMLGKIYIWIATPLFLTKWFSGVFAILTVTLLFLHI